MTKGKQQSVRKGIWFLGGKRLRIRTKRGQKGGALTIELIASAAAPLLSEIAKPISKIIFRRERIRRQNILLR